MTILSFIAIIPEKKSLSIKGCNCDRPSWEASLPSPKVLAAFQNLYQNFNIQKNHVGKVKR